MQDKCTAAVDVAWAAGLFEGEGCWRIRLLNGSVQSVTAQLSSTDRDVVERFAAVVGYGTIREVRPPNPRAKLQHSWSGATRADVKRMAESFLPHLGERRAQRAREILETPDSRLDRKAATHCVHGHPFDEENTYWYVKDGYEARHCRVCRKAQNSPEKQRQRRHRRQEKALSA